MKEHKVGDTIYAKGKIIQVAESHGKFPYCVSFSDSDFTRIIDMCHAWLDEDSFVEPPAKPTLPKDVADELEYYKLKGFDLIDYFTSFNEGASDVNNSSNYVYDNKDEVNNQRVANLANAWNNGYVLEQEHLYLAYIPLPFNDIESDDNQWNCAQLCRHSEGKLDWCAANMNHLDSINEDYKFTQEEIKRITEGYPTIITKEVREND